MKLHRSLFVTLITIITFSSCEKSAQKPIVLDTTGLNTSIFTGVVKGYPQPFYLTTSPSFTEALVEVKKNDFKVVQQEYDSSSIAVVYSASDNSYGSTFDVYIYNRIEFERKGIKSYYWRRIMQFTVGSCISIRLDFEGDNNALQIFGRFHINGEEELILEHKRFRNAHKIQFTLESETKKANKIE